jgi:hypothetical protein
MAMRSAHSFAAVIMHKIVTLAAALIASASCASAQALLTDASGKTAAAQLVLSAELAAPTSDDAEVLLSDSFDREAGGKSALNYNAFENWLVKGQVDLVADGGWGIKCAGSCVDLDGSPGEGHLITNRSFLFNAGDVMRIAVDVSGSQRSEAFDTFVMTLLFDSEQKFASYSTDIGGKLIDSRDGVGVGSSFTQMASIGGTAPFATWFFEFTAASAGAVQYAIGSTSSDAVGPMIDNVLITRASGSASVSTVPEPATSALMLTGLGALGVMLRRRQTAARAKV